MRTTISLDDGLFAEAKQFAARTGRTFTSVVEDALREMLSRGKGRKQRRIPVRLPTFRGNGLLPGVDLDDSAALLDLMEASRDSD